jgi:hypothetical protein
MAFAFLLIGFGLIVAAYRNTQAALLPNSKPMPLDLPNGQRR